MERISSCYTWFDVKVLSGSVWCWWSYWGPSWWWWGRLRSVIKSLAASRVVLVSPDGWRVICLGSDSGDSPAGVWWLWWSGGSSLGSARWAGALGLDIWHLGSVITVIVAIASMFGTFLGLFVFVFLRHTNNWEHLTFGNTLINLCPLKLSIL